MDEHPTMSERGFCECGCGRRTNISKVTDPSRGAVKGQPRRFVAGHNARKSPVAFVVDVATGCWNWQRSSNGQGYGRKLVNGSRVYAHRFFYELLIGPIPEGLELDHLCRNPRCVNPVHLEPVTHRVNLRRGKVGSKTHCKHGHDISRPETVWISAKGHRMCKACDRRRRKAYWKDRRPRRKLAT